MASQEKAEISSGTCSDGERRGSSADSASINVAAAELKLQQQRPEEADRLQAEIRLLEKRLGIKGDTGVFGDRGRKQLREELSKDGIDTELQDILDDILVCQFQCRLRKTFLDLSLWRYVCRLSFPPCLLLRAQARGSRRSPIRWEKTIVMGTIQEISRVGIIHAQQEGLALYVVDGHTLLQVHGCVFTSYLP